MDKKNSTVLILFLLFFMSDAVAQKLGNITFVQDGNRVKINYIMSGITTGQKFDVKIVCSEDGGESYTIVPRTITNTGTALNLKNGINTAVWTVKKDRNKLDGNNFVFKVMVNLNTEPEMILVKGGTFQMGSTSGDDDEIPIHTVNISDFYIGKYEVTIEQYMEFVYASNSNYPQWLEKGNSYNINEKGEHKNYYRSKGMSLDDKDKNKPITGVSWDNAIAYCKWLSQKTGKNYRLPTEAEWEFTAGGGSSHQKWAGTSSETSLSDYVWYDENSNSVTHEVGTKLPNSLGIYDMSGNVWEWCQDKWHDKYERVPTDGSAWETGNSPRRVSRGGSWFNGIGYCRVANRISGNAFSRSDNLGFRLARRP